MKRVLLFLSLVLCFPLYSNAQSWSGIIAPSRATDWSRAGITGGIPNRTTKCATLSPGATVTDINSALRSCPTGEVVYLNAGTYNLGSGQISFAGVQNVTLRGAGADKTFLNFTGSTGYGCGGGPGHPAICVGGSTGVNRNSPQNLHNWTGNYSRGTTTLQFDSVSGYQVGTLLVLDQEEDTSDTGNMFVTELVPYSNEAYSPGRNCGNSTPGCRSQQEFVRVTAANPSANTITVDPPITLPNWRSSQSPQGWSIGVIGSTVGELDGVEDLSVNPDAAGSAVYDDIAVNSCYQCWVKGVRAIHNYERDAIGFSQTLQSEVVNSYVEGGTGGTDSYGIDAEWMPGSHGLIMNNITQHVSPGVALGNAVGWVIAYNFGIDDLFTSSPGWFDGNIRGHDAGDSMNLIEGNITPGFWFDCIHGTQNFMTFFRNQSTGYQSNDNSNTFALRIDSYVRYSNVIGNVFGTAGYDQYYENDPSTYHNMSTTIYSFGLSYNGTVASDNLAFASSYRWGNYDTVNGSVQWNSSEVPSSLSPYGNSVPSSHSLPGSFFLSAKPGWWPSSIPWPAIGPDVTGGNISGVGGHANENPAMNCYLNVMGGNPNGGSTAYSFNENSCYAQGGNPPAPPMNLSANPH